MYSKTHTSFTIVLYVFVASILVSACRKENDSVSQDVEQTAESGGNSGTIVPSGAGGESKHDTLPPQEDCHAKDLEAGETVEITYKSDVAPTPQDGTLPNEGTFVLTEWTIHDAADGPAGSHSGAYRFGENNKLDINLDGTKGSGSWSLASGHLIISIDCPKSLAGSPQAFRYSFDGQTLLLFSDDGMMTYQKN